MNSSELAQKMLEWEQTQTKADVLALEIREAVLALGKTQTVGNVRATYSNGRKSYDYEAAWREKHQDYFPENDYARVSYDYKKACSDYGISIIPFTESAPSVTVKLVG